MSTKHKRELTPTIAVAACCGSGRGRARASNFATLQVQAIHHRTIASTAESEGVAVAAAVAASRQSVASCNVPLATAQTQNTLWTIAKWRARSQRDAVDPDKRRRKRSGLGRRVQLHVQGPKAHAQHVAASPAKQLSHPSTVKQFHRFLLPSSPLHVPGAVKRSPLQPLQFSGRATTQRVPRSFSFSLGQRHREGKLGLSLSLS